MGKKGKGAAPPTAPPETKPGVFLTPPTLSLLATEAYLCARLASETTELAFLRVGGREQRLNNVNNTNGC